MKKTMLVKAEKQDNNEFALVGDNGDKPQEGYTYPTKLAAYQAAMELWPANSVWHGCMTHDGYRIDIE